MAKTSSAHELASHNEKVTDDDAYNDSPQDSGAELEEEEQEEEEQDPDEIAVHRPLSYMSSSSTPSPLKSLLIPGKLRMPKPSRHKYGKSAWRATGGVDKVRRGTTSMAGRTGLTAGRTASTAGKTAFTIGRTDSTPGMTATSKSARGKVPKHSSPNDDSASASSPAPEQSRTPPPLPPSSRAVGTVDDEEPIFHVADWLEYHPRRARVLTAWQPCWITDSQREYWAGGWNRDARNKVKGKKPSPDADDCIDTVLYSRDAKDGKGREHYVSWKLTEEDVATFVVSEGFGEWLEGVTQNMP